MANTDQRGRIPVTVLTGYLGAGKTTVLNQVLSKNHGQRIAVIENEFGEIGVDNELVIQSDEEIFEMNNGCICCTVRGDLLRTLGNLVRRKNKFDRVLIETTGVADPGPVAQTFFREEDIAEKYWLDAIITVVDARHLSLHLHDSPECQRQIAFADVILLNKMDLVSKQEADALEETIRRINPLARAIRCTRGEVDLKQVLSVGGFDVDRAIEVDPAFLKEEDHHHHHDHHDHDHDHDHDHKHDHSHDHHHHNHVHDSEVGSVSIVLEGDLDPKKFEGWMNMLLQHVGNDLFRYKGILAIAGESNRIIFQGVHMLMEEKRDRPWGDQPRVNRFVFIGRNLEKDILHEAFRRCLVGVNA
ncbi:MAG: GTP-binding protein [Candidatus Sumerlaeia bacterium]|nr:GTP-binding protein [Candidatus Sumerlaeia bacterium]